VDSWDSMMTYQEDDAPLGDTPQVASPATLQTRWSKKIQDAFNPVYRCPECGFAPLTKEVTKYETMNFGWQCPSCKWKGLDPGVEVNETTIYCIRQVRAKIMTGGGKMYGRPYDSKGAHALLHANHVRVSVHSGQFIKETKPVRKIGKEISWDIRKAKAGAREGATGKFDLYFRPLEVDIANDVLATCIKYGVIATLPGGWYEIPDVEGEEEGEVYKVRSKNAMLETLERNPELVDVLQELVYIKSDLSHVRFR
jgi:ribosomal protein L37AE/L43A